MSKIPKFNKEQQLNKTWDNPSFFKNNEKSYIKQKMAIKFNLEYNKY